MRAGRSHPPHTPATTPPSGTLTLSAVVHRDAYKPANPGRTGLGEALDQVGPLWAVHGRLRSECGAVGGTLESVAELLGWESGIGRTDGVPPDRLVGPVGEDEWDAHMLDLDELDAAGNPKVVEWDPYRFTVGCAQPFWNWFDDTATRLIWLPEGK